jgi:small ligand-binding sensory domain FIST
VQESFANDVAWLGFHSYGELAPLGGRVRFHNYTMALCAAYDV